VGSSTSNDPDFPDEFCRFLQKCVTTVDAAELLLALFSDRQRWWAVGDLCAQLAPVASLSEVDVQHYLGLWENCSLVARDAEQRAQYRSAMSHDPHVTTLARLYLERPVTLFRVIYGLRDSAIHTFADAFKLRG
jgi:hypothetical protein